MSKNEIPQKSTAFTRQNNYSEWYQQVIKDAELADHADVRGCMVIRPWGYGIWENIQGYLDSKFKETGHKNAYFPLLIPLSFLQKEAEHVAGFAKECAVVTHRRLVTDENGKLVPAGKLEEPMIIRPTSETIIGSSFSKWVQSYRDLPILINQWANVMRWEMRTRLFLRTSEFLWQEGHTVHETAEDAQNEAKLMLNVYTEFAHNVLAMPVIKGEKTKSERFPGATNTYTIEAMMQDNRALQAGTSHFLGQNFAKAQDIKFLGRDGKEAHAWTTSWGVSTRLIGGLIMTHSDDNGLVLPPRVAPTHVVLLPIVRDEKDADTIHNYLIELAKDLKGTQFDGKPIEVEIDAREGHGGQKFWKWIKKGVPLVVEVGMRDIQNSKICYTRRDLCESKEGKRVILDRADFIKNAPTILQNIQDSLYNKAKERQEKLIFKIDSEKALWDLFPAITTTSDANADETDKLEPGFAHVHLADDPTVIEKLEARKLTIRCIPINTPNDPGKCIFTGVSVQKRLLVAKAY